MSVVILSIITVIGLILFWIKNRYNYWIRHGFLQHEPTNFPFGSLKGVGVTMHILEFNEAIYQKFKKKAAVVGCYFFLSPVLFILDLDVVKSIFIKDFETFIDRGTYYNANSDPMTANLFNVHGDYWKNLRHKLSPAFTSGKIKMMFNIILDISQEMVDYVEQNIGETEVKDVIARYTTDVFGNVGFGLDINSMKDPNTEFRVMGKKSLNWGKFGFTKTLILASMWKVTKHLPFRIFSKEVNDFFLKTVADTVHYRETSGYQRNDLLNLLIQIKNQGKIDGEEADLGKMSLKELTAQCFVFFLGGFETSSAASSFCLYELAKNQEIQEKLRSEIEEVTRKHDGKITYDSISEMEYLQMTLDETLRMYPAIENIPRKCNKDYRIAGTKYVIPKDTLTLIPVSAIHFDPEFYPDPHKFDPERFSNVNKHKRHPMAYIPFGTGPRNCIGARFGFIQSKVALVQLLSKFKFSVCSRTPIPMEFAYNTVVLTSKNDIWLNVEKL